MKTDILAIIAIIISFASALFSRRQAGEAQNMRKIAQGEVAEIAIEELQSVIEKIKSCDAPEEIDTFTKEVVRRLKTMEISLGKMKIKHAVICQLWEAVNEKRAFLEFGTGKVIVPGGTIAPSQKLSVLEGTLRLTTYEIRNQLKL